MNRVAVGIELGGRISPWGNRHGSSRSIRVALGPTPATRSESAHDAASSNSHHDHRAAPPPPQPPPPPPPPPPPQPPLQQQHSQSGSSEAHATPSRRLPPTPPPPPCTSRASSTIAMSNTQSPHAQSPPWSSAKAGAGIRDGIAIRQHASVSGHHSPFVGASQGGAGVHAVYQTTQPHSWQPFVPPSVPSVTIFHDFTDAADVDPYVARHSAISVAIAGQAAATTTSSAAPTALTTTAALLAPPDAHHNDAPSTTAPTASNSMVLASASASARAPPPSPPPGASKPLVKSEETDLGSDGSPPPTPSSLALSATPPTVRSHHAASWLHSSPLRHPPLCQPHSWPLCIHSTHSSPPLSIYSTQSLATRGVTRGKRAQSWASKGSWQAAFHREAIKPKTLPRQAPSWRRPPPTRTPAAVIQPAAGAETQLVVRATLAYRQAPSRPSGPPPPPRIPRRAWAEVWAEDEEKRQRAREKATLRDQLRRGLCRGRPSTAAQKLRQDLLLRAPPPSPKPHQAGGAGEDDHGPPAPPSISGEPPDPMPLGVDAIMQTPVLVRAAAAGPWGSVGP